MTPVQMPTFRIAVVGLVLLLICGAILGLPGGLLNLCGARPATKGWPSASYRNEIFQSPQGHSVTEIPFLRARGWVESCTHSLLAAGEPAVHHHVEPRKRVWTLITQQGMLRFKSGLSSHNKLLLNMISIVMPAHNEGLVIARTLRAITTGALPDELDVVVVCNGCTDDTAAIARGFGAPVRVIETAVGNKANALNLGDQAARAFPRIYVDADVVVTLSTARALAECLEKEEAIAVAPMPYFELRDCSWPVRAFYDIRRRLPSFSEGIGGSGVYALSEIGRRRFGAFPNLVADDTYVRVQFKPEERKTSQLRQINRFRSAYYPKFDRHRSSCRFRNF